MFVSVVGEVVQADRLGGKQPHPLCRGLSMIPKSGRRFSEKIMFNQKTSGESDPTQLNQTLAEPAGFP